MSEMVSKLTTLYPEMALLVGALVCLFIGLAPTVALRRSSALVAAIALLVALFLAIPGVPPEPVVTPEAEAAVATAPAGWTMASYIKIWTCIIGLGLLFLAKAVPGRLKTDRDVDEGREPFDPAIVTRGEFFAFFLLSLAGLMFTTGSSDLVWLFLALELTSLPTYIMVATSRDRVIAQESGVKYFFLGALSVAVFLYGFTLIYGVTGYTDFALIRAHLVANPELLRSPLLLLGVALAVIGISFKIAAVPMHFYTPDVYQGATTPVTTFLAFVPKTAGFAALILVLGLVRGMDGTLPEAIAALLWIMAALTMTVGNILGLLQTSVKRLLAYSSIAHSGYMLVGLLGSSLAGGDDYLSNGVAGVLFYLVAYGLGNLGAFGVLTMLERSGEEAESFEDLNGLSRRRPALAFVMLVSALSLIGLPPMMGFLGKIYLFAPAIEHGYIVLVVIAVINSAISAVYYLRMAAACYFGTQDRMTRSLEAPLRQVTITVSAVAVVALGVVGGWLVDWAGHAAPQVARVVEAELEREVEPPVLLEPAAEADRAGEPVSAAR